jgi:hypothetical protein
MRVLLYGSSQTKHIKRIFKKYGIEVYELDSNVKKSRLKGIWDYIIILMRVDVVYRIYGPSYFDPKLVIAKLFHKKIVVHWIGSDVLEILKKNKKISTKLIRLIINENIAGSELLQRELKQLRVNSEVIAIVPELTSLQLSGMPDNHSVLVYAPEGKEDFYGLQYVERLAQIYTEIKFYIVGNSNDSIKLKNVIFCGMLPQSEMDSLYDEISILFRFPEHDGLSLMLLEALARGKAVLYSYTFPYVETPASRDLEDVKKSFDELIKNKPIINRDGASFISEKFSDDNIMKLYKEILE